MIKMAKLLAEVQALAEKTGEELIASKVAKKLGLVYKGFGRWADPKTNKIVAKTLNGKLVKVEPHDDGEATDRAEKGYSAGTMQQLGKKLDGQPGQADADNKTAAYQTFLAGLVNSEGKLSPEKNAKAVATSVTIANQYAKERNIKLAPDVAREMQNAKQSPSEYEASDFARIAKFLGEVPIDKYGNLELYFNVDTSSSTRGTMYNPPEAIEYEGTHTFEQVDNDLLEKLQWNEDGEWEYSPPVPDYDDDRY